jgi:hypothetical protein
LGIVCAGAVVQKNVQRHLAYITLPLAAGLVASILLSPIHGLRTPRTGFPIRVASDTCFCGDLGDRVIFLHISTSRLSINFQEVDRRDLAGRLANIYRTRAEKVLYLSADDDVSFQVVADVVDIAQHLPDGTGLGVPLPQGLKETEGNMNVLVELVTQRAVDGPCRANCFNLAKQFPVDR